ncbi:hypothetical protein [Pseudomonas sp. dw_358]|uniref:hypothetical protein n=1 Tax=Pseudomonas sp. dw_358 TaxID=2720083 RepID=UPI001BD37580|nr:hypothetical protein [Pseudomonas sp. dw_358]
MNSALYLLNALALVALVSFHYNSDSKDPAEIHLQTSQFVHHPVAQLAVMHAQAGEGHFTQAQEGADFNVGPRTERFTF